MLLRGVRNSCDMLARNSDLYFDVRASSFAFSSRARRACSISSFFLSTSTFCAASCCAFCANCSLVCCNSLCWVCSSAANCCDCLSRASVCMVASILFRTIPMLEVSCSRNARWEAVKKLSDASSMTALTRSSKSTGKTMTLRGFASKRPERIGTVPSGRSLISMRRFSRAHCPTRPSPGFTRRRCPSGPSEAKPESSTMPSDSSVSIW